MRVFDTVKQRFSEVVGKQEGRTVTDPTGSAPVLSSGTNSQYVHNVEWQEVDDQREGGKGKIVVGTMTFEEKLAEHGVRSVTRFDTFWRKFIEFFIIVCELAFMVLMGYGNGALFAGLHPWNTSWLVDAMYVFGFLLEAATMVFLITAALAYRDGEDRRTIVAGIWAGVFCLISVSCQIGFIYASAAVNEFDAFTSVALRLHVAIPYDLILLGRAVAPTLVAIGLAFILPEKKNDIAGAIARQEDEANAVYKLDSNKVHMRQLDIANGVTLHIMDSMATNVERAADAWLAGNSDIFKLEPPKMIVEDAHQELPPARKQPVRAIQRQPAPKQPVQQPIPLPQKPASEPAVPKYSDDEIRRYMRMALARNAGATVSDARRIAAQYGVDPDRVEKIFLEVKGDDASVQRPVSVASNGKHPVQQLDREQLTRMQTSSIDTTAMSATWEPVVVDDVPEDDEKGDDLPFV